MAIAPREEHWQLKKAIAPREEHWQLKNAKQAKAKGRGGGTIGTSTIVRGRTHVINDVAGHLRPASVARDPGEFSSGAHAANKGQRYSADPPTVEEIIVVMHVTGDGADGVMRGLIVVLWRAGLRISEALALRRSVDRAVPGRAVHVKWPSRLGQIGVSLKAASPPSRADPEERHMSGPAIVPE